MSSLSLLCHCCRYLCLCCHVFVAMSSLYLSLRLIVVNGFVVIDFDVVVFVVLTGVAFTVVVFVVVVMVVVAFVHDVVCMLRNHTKLQIHTSDKSLPLILVLTAGYFKFAFVKLQTW